MKARASLKSLRKVYIEVRGQRVVAWEPKDPSLRSLGRWTDPEALLRRIHDIEDPQPPEVEGPGRQWAQSWRARLVARPKGKAKRAA